MKLPFQWLRPLLLAPILILSPCPGMAGEQPSTQPVAAISVAPVMRCGAAPSSHVTLCIRNESKQPIRYVPDTAMSGMVSLELKLYRGDRQLRLQIYPDPLLREDLVRVLTPGKTIVQSFDLDDFYGKLDPGTYELRVSCLPCHRLVEPDDGSL